MAVAFILVFFGAGMVATSIAFEANGHGRLTVYVIAPCLGSLCGGFLATRLFLSA